MKKLLLTIAILFSLTIATISYAQEPKQETDSGSYTVGIGDILEISVLQPEKLLTAVTVAPDGTITFPYVGNVRVKGLTLGDIQNNIQNELADGYMKYPVVLVSLRESRSRRFFVYGEVIRPGAYPISENTTVLKAISVAGGFTKFGSSSRVKILRMKEEGTGYEPIKVNIKAILNGDSKADIVVQPEDIIVISEGIF